MINSINIAYNAFSRFHFYHGLRLLTLIKTKHVGHLKLPGYTGEIHLRKNTTDIDLFNNIILGSQYHYLKFPSKPEVIIDGGANIGLFTILMKSKFPDAKVICIEPDGENFQALIENLSEYENVYLEKKGLWNTETKVSVTDKYHTGKWGMITEEDLTGGDVQTVSLEGLMKKYQLERIDLLKLDIESAEKQLFFSNFEYFLPRTKMIVIELHDWILPGCSKMFFEAINKVYKNYEYATYGEETVIINHDLV